MSSKNANGLVGEIVYATSRLVTTLEAEVEALRRGDVASLERTRGEKARQIRSYEARLQALQSQPVLRESVEPALKEELETATRDLQTAIDRNVSQLRAAAEANRRLVDALARAAAEANKRPGYGPGKAAMHPMMRREISAPVTVSRQL